MNGVTMPGVSAGSNHVGASETWTPQVIWPSGAAAAGSAPTAKIIRTRTATERRNLIMSLQRGGSMGNRTMSARLCPGVVLLAGEGEDMLIVDAQIHLWNAGNPTSPWHRQIPAYLKDDAL